MTAFLRAVRHLPKVTPSFFAEFLELLSLEHLSLLDQPTCVGMRYGKNISFDLAVLVKHFSEVESY